MKAIAIRTNGTVEHLDLPKEGSGQEIRDIVGGWFDVVRQPVMNISAYVHDMGLIIGLEPNACASSIFNQLLVGDVVICGATDNEGDHLDLHEKFFEDEFKTYAMGMNNKPDMNKALAELRDKRAREGFTITSI